MTRPIWGKIDKDQRAEAECGEPNSDLRPYLFSCIFCLSSNYSEGENRHSAAGHIHLSENLTGSSLHVSYISNYVLEYPIPARAPCAARPRHKTKNNDKQVFFCNALSHHCTVALVTRPDRPKAVKDVIKQARRAATKLGPGGAPRFLFSYIAYIAHIACI